MVRAGANLDPLKGSIKPTEVGAPVHIGHPIAEKLPP